jgi:hypothetical protein
VPFGRREPYRAGRGGRLLRGEVDREALRLDHGRLRIGAAPPEGRTEARQQLIHAERLGDVVIRADVQGHDLVALAGAGGQDDDGRGAPAAEAFDHVVPIHVGQPEIEDHHIRRIARRGRQGRHTVAYRRHLVVARAQVDGQRLADCPLVVHHEHVRH